VSTRTAKIHTPPITSNTPIKIGGTLDKLVVVTPGVKSTTKNNLKKRSIAKRFTQLQTFDLMSVCDRQDKEDLKMYKYYFRANLCGEVVNESNGKITSKYCNCRHCIVCGRIRTAKGINGYYPQMEKDGKQYYLLTLTKVSVSGSGIEQAFDDMYSVWRQFNKNWNKQNKGEKVKGIRKLECNFNLIANTYNPHYHIVVNSLEFAIALKEYWMQNDSKLSYKAQDIRLVNPGGDNLLEVFKYGTKPLSDKNRNTYQAHVIFKALYGKNLFYPFGGLKKVAEDVADTIALESDTAEIKQYRFDSDLIDWVSEDGELLHELRHRHKDLKKVDRWGKSQRYNINKLTNSK
jgi:hypothetical protein